MLTYRMVIGPIFTAHIEKQRTGSKRNKKEVLNGYTVSHNLNRTHPLKRKTYFSARIKFTINISKL